MHYMAGLVFTDLLTLYVTEYCDTFWQLCDVMIGSTGWIGLLKMNLFGRKVQLAHRRLNAHSRSGRVAVSRSIAGAMFWSFQRSSTSI